MKLPLSCPAFILLVACTPTPPPPPAVPAEPPPAMSPKVPSAASPTGPALAPPSFDCARAGSAAEKLVCGDAELAALDRQLAARYAQATDADPAVQRGWVKERDACWKAEFRNARVQVVWCLVPAGDAMTGSAWLLPGKQRVRKVEARRDPAPPKAAERAKVRPGRGPGAGASPREL